MSRPAPTEVIVLREDDDERNETHPSWILISLNNVSQSPPGANLFDSEISHQHYVSLRITRCERRRSVNRDWFFPTQTILEASMSKAQWGAIASSFGQGTGVPATLEFLHGEGHVPQAPRERRLDTSHREVREAGNRALARIVECEKAVQEAYERRAGRKELSPLLNDLHHAIRNAPANMEFAAESLTEHVEKVVTKARADVEGMIAGVIIANGGTLPPEGLPLPSILELEQGDDLA